MSEQAPEQAGQDGQDTQPQEDMFSRATTTLGQDGQQLTQFETPSARTGSPHAGQPETATQGGRPHYSPVAQPGMVSEIHWHTVKTEQRDGHPARPAHERPTRGMFARLHQHQQGKKQQQGGGGGG